MVTPNDNFDYPQKIKKIISMYFTPHRFSEMINSSDKNLKLRFVAKYDVVFLSGNCLLITAKSLSQFHLLLHMLEIKEGSVTAEMRFAGTVQIDCNHFSEKDAKNYTFTL